MTPTTTPTVACPRCTRATRRDCRTCEGAGFVAFRELPRVNGADTVDQRRAAT